MENARLRQVLRHWLGRILFVVILEPGMVLLAQEPAAPTFILEIPRNRTVCGTFGLAGPGRGLRQELELKSQVRFREGTIALPTTSERFPGELFEEVIFGPRQEVATPRSPGEFRVFAISSQDDVTVYRFTHEQEFSLGDGRTLELETVAPLQFRARGSEVLSDPVVLDEAFFTKPPGSEAVVGLVDGVPLVRYGSCAYELLPLREIRVELEDGTSLRIEERNGQASTSANSEPSRPIRAEVVLVGQARVVESYWDLVYSAFMYNTSPQFWIVLEPAANIGDLSVPVRTIELVGVAKTLGPLRGTDDLIVRYLDGESAVISNPRVLSFETNVLENAPFRRGDVNDDRTINILDAVLVLRSLFEDAVDLPCLRSADVNANDTLEVPDALFLLNYLFIRGPMPSAPFRYCDFSRSPSALSCEVPTCGSLL